MSQGDLARAQAGDVQAFEGLISQLLPPAYRLALSILRDEGRAEDAVQEAAVKAWKKVSGLRDEAALRSWFLTIVANQSRSALRTRSWLPLPFRIGQSGAAADEVASQRLDIYRALQGLGSDDRLAIYLYYYLDLEVTEAARIAGVSTSAFRSRLARATKRMRPMLVAEEPDHG